MRGRGGQTHGLQDGEGFRVQHVDWGGLRAQNQAGNGLPCRWSCIKFALCVQASPAAPDGSSSRWRCTWRWFDASGEIRGEDPRKPERGNAITWVGKRQYWRKSNYWRRVFFRQGLFQFKRIWVFFASAEGLRYAVDRNESYKKREARALRKVLPLSLCARDGSKKCIAREVHKCPSLKWICIRKKCEKEKHISYERVKKNVTPSSTSCPKWTLFHLRFLTIVDHEQPLRSRSQPGVSHFGP